jgi:hypothetical protein
MVVTVAAVGRGRGGQEQNAAQGGGYQADVKHAEH